MASTSLRATPKSASFICNSCLNKLSPPWSARLASPCYRSVASSASFATSARKSSTLPRCRPPLSPRSFAGVAEHSSKARPYSTAAPLPQPADSGIAPLPHRRLISVSGPDAAKLLQGLISNDVSPTRNSPFYSAFLDARGRVLWDVFIWTYPELYAGQGQWACYIEVDAEEIENLYKHLRRHKLRSKVELKIIGEGEMSVWAAWGSQLEQLSDESLVETLVDPRGPKFAVRLLYSGAEGPSSNQDISRLDTQQYHLRRYLYGIPEGQQEIMRESSLPMECNIDLNQGINFKKGCYVGQELTIRTKHTGVVRKRILPVQLYKSDSLSTSTAESKVSEVLTSFDPTSTIKVPEAGSDIKQLGEDGSIKKGRAAGKFIAGIGNVGLALCRLEMMTSMKVSAEGGSWKPGVEFGIEKDGEVVRVKPIVYQWFRERERDVWDKGRTRV